MSVTLVTGATGFIGRHLMRQLLAEQECRWEYGRIRLLVREPARLPRCCRGRVDVVRGDLTDPNTLAAAVEGAHTVLHLAALARAWDPDPDLFRRANRDAVETLLEAAARGGVQSFVHVSSVLAVPPHSDAGIEGGWNDPTPYERTKQESEELVRSYVRSGGRAVIVRPTRVYGPGPLTEANGVTRVVDAFLRGRFRVRLADQDVVANYVHVGDVAAGILLAERFGRSGASYFLGGEDVSLRGLLELVASIAGVRRRVVALPPRLVLMTARASEELGRLGLRPPIPAGWVRIFLEDRPVDSGRSCRELGYRPRDLRCGLTQTIRWLRDAGGSVEPTSREVLS